MSVLAAATAAALLIASPSATDAARVAANGGFLLGNAHRCGIESDRIVRTGRLIRDLIGAAAEDAREEEEATVRFARFFIVSAFVDPTADKLVVSCRKVSREFERLERHPSAAAGSNAASEGAAGSRFHPGDGE